MVRTWKYWLSAAAALLMVGAGCGEAVRQQAALEGRPPQLEVKTGTGTDVAGQARGKVDVDAVVDAAVKESDDDASASMEAGDEAGALNDDSAELNAYGQAYVDSEAR